MLNRPEEALSHLKTAERLMPGSHLMWAVKAWRCRRATASWADGRKRTQPSMRPSASYPACGIRYVVKAVCCVQLGQDAEARRHIETARRLGWELAQAERLWRRVVPKQPDARS